jgi:hypothetical protein
VLADAGHRSMPVARRNPTEAAAFVGHDCESAVLGFSDDKRIRFVPSSWIGKLRVHGTHPALNRFDRVDEDMRGQLLAPLRDLVVLGHKLSIDLAWRDDAALGHRNGDDVPDARKRVRRVMIPASIQVGARVEDWRDPGGSVRCL